MIITSVMLLLTLGSIIFLGQRILSTDIGFRLVVGTLMLLCVLGILVMVAHETVPFTNV
jgi:hypothetical protein